MKESKCGTCGSVPLNMNCGVCRSLKLLRTKCSYADKYKAIHPPRCLGGKVCDVCREKWDARVAKEKEHPGIYCRCKECV